MRKMDYQNVKGTADYLPEAEGIRRKVRNTLEDVFIQYGCKPLETPILNYTDLLASKYGGGAEILKEMYVLSDRGERDLALRYDLTIPYAKVVAMNPTLKLPFKRYEIGKVFRDGPIKKGRMREFTQCDVDVTGIDSCAAEAELIMMALDAFDRLEMEVVIQYNNRKLLAGMLESFGIPPEKSGEVILVLDKLEKIGLEACKEELKKKGLSAGALDETKQFILASPTCLEYFSPYVEKNTLISEGLAELRELKKILEGLGLNAQCQFNPYLARGLDIYTGTIYELFMKDGSLRSSIGSGGRYHNAIAGLKGEEGGSYSTVGISFGLDVILTALLEKEETSPDPWVDYLIIPVQEMGHSFRMARVLRQEGNRVEVDMSGRSVRKSMDYARKVGIPFVAVIGEREVSNRSCMVKDMMTGNESEWVFR